VVNMPLALADLETGRGFAITVGGRSTLQVIRAQSQEEIWRLSERTWICLPLSGYVYAALLLLLCFREVCLWFLWVQHSSS